jgi:hypothetical protein
MCVLLPVVVPEHAGYHALQAQVLQSCMFWLDYKHHTAVVHHKRA